MQFELINIKTEEQLIIFDMHISLYGIYILDINYVNEKYYKDKTQDELKIYLTSLIDERSHGGGLDFDEKAIKVLHLEKVKTRFGRMNDYRYIVGLLENYRSNEDDLQIYPIKNEMISFIGEDSNFGNIYILEKRK